MSNYDECGNNISWSMSSVFIAMSEQPNTIVQRIMKHIERRPAIVHNLVAR